MAGRPSTVTFKVEKKEVILNLKKVEHFLKSKVKPNSSGAYIPMSQKFKHKDVYVVVVGND